MEETAQIDFGIFPCKHRPAQRRKRSTGLRHAPTFPQEVRL